jgi:cellulose biosynthesis protein BcsQ
MHVIVFASQKGGSGKTTLCDQLAIQAERAGAGPVALIDTYPQGSLPNGGTPAVSRRRLSSKHGSPN